MSSLAKEIQQSAIHGIMSLDIIRAEVRIVYHTISRSDYGIICPEDGKPQAEQRLDIMSTGIPNGHKFSKEEIEESFQKCVLYADLFQVEEMLDGIKQSWGGFRKLPVQAKKEGG